MWEVYLGLALFTAVWGFIKLSQNLTESESGIETYDKLQSTGVGVMKLFFSLLAVFTILLGFLISPSVIDASLTANNNTANVNQTQVDSINDLTNTYSWVTSAAALTYLLLGLIFLIAFIFLNYTNIAKKLLIGKGRKGKRK